MAKQLVCRCGTRYTEGPLPGGGYQPRQCECYKATPANPPKGR